VQHAVIGATQRLGKATTPICPKCGGSMELGFIPDEYRDRNEVTVWVQGEAKRDPLTGELELGGSRMWRVATYRCSACAYLESYARDEITVEDLSA
jgi:hypothetical protein